MGKQKKIVEVPVTSKEEREELQTIRMTFVCLLMMIVNGGQVVYHPFPTSNHNFQPNFCK